MLTLRNLTSVLSCNSISRFVFFVVLFLILDSFFFLHLICLGNFIYFIFFASVQLFDRRQKAKVRQTAMCNYTCALRRRGRETSILAYSFLRVHSLTPFRDGKVCKLE